MFSDRIGVKTASGARQAGVVRCFIHSEFALCLGRAIGPAICHARLRPAGVPQPAAPCCGVGDAKVQRCGCAASRRRGRRRRSETCEKRGQRGDTERPIAETSPSPSYGRRRQQRDGSFYRALQPTLLLPRRLLEMVAPGFGHLVAQHAFDHRARQRGDKQLHEVVDVAAQPGAAAQA